MGASAEIPGSPPQTALSYFVGYLLRRANVRFTADTSDARVDPRQLAVLEALAERDWLAQVDLAEELGINRTIMVWIIDQMEQSGYVERNRNPENRRSYVLSLTPAGVAGLERMREVAVQRDLHLVSALTEAERERLRELLSGLVPDRVAAGHARIESLVARAHTRYRKLGDDLLADIGLRMRHFGPITALEVLQPCAQQQLAQFLMITEPAAAELVDDLVKTGAIRRGRDKHDRRRYALELTDEGRAMLGRVRETVERLQADAVERIGADGEQELRALLMKVLGASREETTRPR